MEFRRETEKEEHLRSASESYSLCSEMCLFPALSDSISIVFCASERERGIIYMPGGTGVKLAFHTHNMHLTKKKDLSHWGGWQHY